MSGYRVNQALAQLRGKLRTPRRGLIANAKRYGDSKSFAAHIAESICLFLSLEHLSRLRYLRREFLRAPTSWRPHSGGTKR